MSDLTKQTRQNPARGTLPELLLPAGDLTRLRMALSYGADAVYMGAQGLSMRPDQVSADGEQLEAAVEMTHGLGKRIYVAANILLSEADLSRLGAWLRETRHIPFDALIVSDLGGVALARELRPELPVHISTQMSTANHRAAKVLAQLGAKRVVLAREASLDDAARIVEADDIEVEIFVHGAMCVAVSGRCLLSAHLTGRSGNKGECKHSCRWEWQLVEQKRPEESLPVFQTEKQTIFLGSKDLCLVEHIPAVIQSGVHALKVEGRMKSPYYVATVARAYRAALDAYGANPEGYVVHPAWLGELNAVSHRPFSTGFAFGYPEHDPAALQTHNHPVSDCQLVAYVDRIKDGRFLMRVKNPFASGEELEWVGPPPAEGGLKVEGIWSLEGAPLERTISATVVQVALSGADLPPVDGIVRRRMRPK